MKFYSYVASGRAGLAVAQGEGFRGLIEDARHYPGDLLSLIQKGEAALRAAFEAIIEHGGPLPPREWAAPFMPPKIFCVGLNYADHAAESQMALPEFPTIFSRFASSLIGPRDPIRLPRVSTALDFEGELAAVVGRGGRYIEERDALAHIAGYCVFNDASIRDYQLRTPQWMIGKNFDGTGPFGPCFVSADELPRGAAGLKIETRLNGVVMQHSSTDQLIFNVARLVSAISEAVTLEPGDLIVTGTPAGVGGARKPPVFMKAGDLCEVQIEGIGILANPIAADA